MNNELDAQIRGYVDPTLVVTKECPMCETIFESPRFYGKKYCSPRCRRRAKNYRETRRYKDLEESVLNPKSPFFMTITNPSIEQLNKMTKLVGDELTNDKPVQFFGLIPETWSAPDSVIFQKQQKLSDNDPDTWIMFHPAMVE